MCQCVRPCMPSLPSSLKQKKEQLSKLSLTPAVVFELDVSIWILKPSSGNWVANQQTEKDRRSVCWLASQFPDESSRIQVEMWSSHKTAGVSECLLNFFPPSVMLFKSKRSSVRKRHCIVYLFQDLELERGRLWGWTLKFKPLKLILL